MAKHTVLMPIMIRYRRCRYRISADKPGLASVTSWGWSRRDPCVLLTVTTLFRGLGCR
jgi:hypothetical protein